MPRLFDWRAILPKRSAPAVASGHAAVDLLAEIWPERDSGHCHTAGLALGGILAGSGWSEVEAMAFADEVFAAAGIEGNNLPDAAHASYTAKKAGGKAYGRPKLRECLDGTQAQADAMFLALDTLMRSSNLVRGDDTEIANCILAEQLKGAVSDEGAVWLQNERGVWEEVPTTRIDVWVMDFSGMEYLGEPSPDGKQGKKMLSVGAPRCKSVRFLIESKLADATGPGFFAERTPGVAFQNGLLRLDGRGLAPLATARVRRVLPFDYATGVASPAWDAFVASVWPGDQESVDCLHEILGYLLSGRMDQQKAFVFIGPPRAGKGTVFQVLRALLGEDCGAFTVNNLGDRFGLVGLLRRTVAIHADFRKAKAQDVGMVAQRLLSITGCDLQCVERKNKADVNVVLPSRLLIGTNVAFGVSDLGGAISKRLVLLRFVTSHLGREDTGLAARLLRELPGIVCRLLEGLARLDARGHFIEPAASAEERAAAEDLENPMGRFFEEECIIHPDAEVSCVAMHRAMREWRMEHGYRSMSTGSFWQLLRAEGVSKKRIGTDANRARVYVGVKLANVQNVQQRPQNVHGPN